MGKRDDHPKTRPDERIQLPLGFGETSRGERRPLRFESERLATRQRIERGSAHLQVEAQLVPPQLANLRRSPDEVGCRGKSSVRGLVSDGVREVGPALCRRKDRRPLEVVERPLRERREGADSFDHVAEELDSDGLAARGAVDVENPPANGDLPTLFHTFDALVAGEHQLLGQRLQPSCRPDGDVDRRRPLVHGRQALRGGSRRHAHEPAVRQHGERAQPLADEVRRHPEARLRRDAASGHERHRLGTGEPRRRFRGVTRILVVG